MELLNKIQRELKVPKAQFNSFSKYNYRNCEDILEAVKPLLGKGELVLTDEIVQIGDRFYVKATVWLQEGEQRVHASAFAREALDKKGMDEAQITGAASSYARKYALCGLFCIDDGEDADSKDNSKPVASAKPVPPKAIANKRDADKKRIKELVDSIVLVEFTTADEYKNYVKENTGYVLVEENYGAIIDCLQAKQN